MLRGFRVIHFPLTSNELFVETLYDPYNTLKTETTSRNKDSFVSGHAKTDPRRDKLNSLCLRKSHPWITCVAYTRWIRSENNMSCQNTIREITPKMCMFESKKKISMVELSYLCTADQNVTSYLQHTFNIDSLDIKKVRVMSFLLFH